MSEDEEKKSLWDKAVDKLTDRDEKAAAAKAAADKIAAEKAAAEKAAAAKAAADRVAAAEKASAERAAVEKKAAAEREAARAAAAAKAAAEKAAAEKEASQEKVAAQLAAAAKAAAERKAAGKKGVVKAHKLYIRADHADDAKSVGGLENGNEVTIYETWTDGKNTWARIGEDQWSAMVSGGKTYIEFAKTEAELKAAEAKAARDLANARKGVVTAHSLYIRADHDANAKSVGGLVAGNEVKILETWTDGKNTWARIGEDQWSAMVYDGKTYIKLEE